MLADRAYAYKKDNCDVLICRFCKGKNLLQKRNDKYKLRTWYYDCCHCHKRNHIYGKDIWLGILMLILLIVKATVMYL